MLCLEKAKGVAMKALAMSATVANNFLSQSTNQAVSSSNTKEMSNASLNIEPKIESIKQNDKKSNGNSEKMQQIEQKLNDIASSENINVKFAYNEKLNMSYISVIDKNTGEEIRKLPSEEAMKISESMKELVGVMFDKKG